MDQIKKIFASLSRQQIITVAVVVVLVGVALGAFVHWNRERGFKPLFTGMSPEDAAAIVQKLKESGVDHRVSANGTTVSVPEARVDEIRLEMAGAGLPKTGRVGFELFDRTNLGITDFTEHVNYRRALEGELERSIKALTAVEQARVHITFPKDSVFLDFREPAKASVLVSTHPGSHLSSQNVLAISNLVASAVEGLGPDFVSVLDMQGNLLSRPRKHAPDESDPSEAALDYKHQIEKDLVSKVEATLEPLLGEGRFRVAVSADCDFSTVEQSEELLDPSKSVMLTSQKSEDIAGSAQAAGVPGTASNLPRAVPRAVGPTTNSSRRTENTSFETSKTIRHVKVPQGSIKRLSASLLIDQEVRWEGKGKNVKRVLVPPTPERLKAINDIVAGVLGVQSDRGDRLVIESLPFEQTLLGEDTSQPAPKTPEKPDDQFKKLLGDKRLIIGAGTGLTLLIAVAGFLMIRKRRKVDAEDTAPALLQPSRKVSAEEHSDPVLTAAAAGIPAQTLDSAAKLQLPSKTGRYEALREHIRESVRKEPQLAADVIRDWLSEGQKAS